MEAPKKVKCPECGGEIDYLRNFQPCTSIYIYKGGSNYELYDTLPREEDGDFECPECSVVLFTNADQANNFLLGIEVPQ